jgi:hypothetical protein
LQDLSIGHRVAITVVIVLAVLFALALYGYLTGNWEEDETARPGYGLASAESQIIQPEICMDEATRERIRDLVLEGIDEALKEHTKHIFSIWLKDSTDQPRRAVTGMATGIRAYLGSRANALKWMPPVCPG